MAISWKWPQLAQKWPTRQFWGYFQHLENFLSLGSQQFARGYVVRLPVWIIDRIRLWSCKQCWSTHVALQHRAFRQQNHRVDKEIIAVQNRVSVGFRNWMGSPSIQGSSPVTPRVWTRAIRMSPLVPLVSPQRVLQLATAPPVAWTAPFHFRLSPSRVHQLLRVAAVASPSSRVRVSVSPAERLCPLLR